jgi:hypothetical protein
VYFRVRQIKIPKFVLLNEAQHVRPQGPHTILTLLQGITINSILFTLEFLNAQNFLQKGKNTLKFNLEANNILKICATLNYDVSLLV